MPKTHHYSVTVKWTGNTGTGTSRLSQLRAQLRDIRRRTASRRSRSTSDPAFRVRSRPCWNPEELLVASISACHKLWYLHLCAVAGIVVLEYIDHAEGEMKEEPDGSGHFTRVILRPQILIAPNSDLAKAHTLHAEAHAKCFIAKSVNFPVEHHPVIHLKSGAGSQPAAAS